MNIVFFGTENFSKTILESIIKANYKVVAVVSQNDKVSGRGNKVKFSEVKKYCIENNIPLLQYVSVSKEGEEDLKKLSADLFITASFGQILKQNILDIPKYGTVNVHASLLPKFRGPAPIEGAIISGENKTGVTIMQTDIGLDTGDIYFSKEIEILKSDTADSMFLKLANLGAKAIVEFLDNFDYYKDKHFKQDETKSSYFGKLKKEDARINFCSNTLNLVNLIRGRSTTSTTYFVYNEKRIKVLFATASEFKIDYDYACGTVINANNKAGLIVKTSDGAIRLNVVQLEGKNVLNDTALLNGFKIVLGSNLNEIVE